MEIMIFVAIVVFAAIWTVLVIIGLRAVLRCVVWLETQKLGAGYGTVQASTHATVEGSTVRATDPDEERVLQEEVALRTAQNRDIEYEGVEHSTGELGREVQEQDDSRTAVEKLRKLNGK